MIWQPMGVGPQTGINWSRLDTLCRTDPYVAWFDATKLAALGPVNRPARPMIPLILELTKPFDTCTCERLLKDFGLHVAGRYLTPPLTRHVTAWAELESGRNSAIAKLQTDICKTAGIVRRFEVSLGFGNPDIRPEGGPCKAPAAPATCESDLAGFIDYGCAFAHRKFRKPGTRDTRIARLWNQQREPDASPPFGKTPMPWKAVPGFFEMQGREVSGPDLDAYVKQFPSIGSSIDEQACYLYAGYEAIRRHATHGTHIMDLATGNPDPSSHGSKAGMEHDVPIFFVQLPRYVDGQQVSGLLRAQVLDALRYIVSFLSAKHRAVVNLSYGSYCGPHDGSSILESAIDELVRCFDDGGTRRLHVVVPAGNALKLDVHAQVHLRLRECETLCWHNLPDDPSESSVEIWLPPGAAVRVRISPPGQAAGPADWIAAGQARVYGNGPVAMAAAIYPTAVCQSARGTMCLLAFGPTVRSPARPPAPYGQWRIELENVSSGSITVNAWCERDDPVFGTEGGPRQSYFSTHVERTGTLNSIAHGYTTNVVGGYLVHPTLDEPAPPVEYRPVADYSGTGPGRDLPGRDRHPGSTSQAALRGPDVLAPSEMHREVPGVLGAAVLSDELVRLPGTSVAAALATRFIIDQRFKADWPMVLKGCPTTAHGEDPHPDDCESIPRIP